MIDILLEAEHALALGFLDKAEKLFSQVATNDPRSAIAVVGLARVALERGEDAGALELVRRARAVDPENPTALRLEARLVEVAAHRAGAAGPAGAGGSAAEQGESAAEQGESAAPPRQPARSSPSKPRSGLLGRFLGRR